MERLKLSKQRIFSAIVTPLLKEIIIRKNQLLLVLNDNTVKYVYSEVTKIPERLPQIDHIVEINGAYKTIGAYSVTPKGFFDVEGINDIPDSELSVYFSYFDPIVESDGTIRYRSEPTKLSELRYSSLDDDEKTSFYKCLGVIPDTSHVVTDDKGIPFVINKTPDGEQKLIKGSITMQMDGCPTVGNYVSVKSDAINVPYDSPWVPIWDNWKNKFEKLDKIKYIEW